MTNNESVEQLKAVNEALWKINKQSEEEIYELRTELLKRQNLEESFCKTTKQFDKRLAKTVKLERTKAIKEFAAKLIVKLDNEALTEFEIYDGYDIEDTKLVIDNLVKEMTDESHS